MKKIFLTFIALLLIVPSTAFAHGGMMDFDNSDSGFEMMVNGGAWHWLAGLTMIVWLIVGILAIIWLSKKNRK